MTSLYSSKYLKQEGKRFGLGGQVNQAYISVRHYDLYI